MFAKVENGVTKSCQNIIILIAGKTGKTHFWPGIFHCFEQDRLLFARVEIGATEFPTKAAKKEDNIFVCLRFFFLRVRVCASIENQNIVFLAAKGPTFGGDGIISKLLAIAYSQYPSWGIYKHAPPVFFAQKTFVILKKGGQIANNTLLLARRQACNTYAAHTSHRLSAPNAKKLVILFLYPPFLQYI